MKKTIDLREYKWTLSGWTPYLWMLGHSMELGEQQSAEIAAIPASVPGSVQMALLQAGIISDWNYGLNARHLEWVENRHWIYSVQMSLDSAENNELSCMLDGSGWILWDGKIIAEFAMQHRPHIFKLPADTEPSLHRLSIVFDTPPRFLGQFGHTSKFTVGKSRFYYTWDWVPRIVQIGITDHVSITQNCNEQIAFSEFWTDADLREKSGIIRLRGRISPTQNLTIRLSDTNRVVLERKISATEFANGVILTASSIELWQPNGCGTAKLYQLDINGKIFNIGFRSLRWLPCQNAPTNADSWLCEINGIPVFIQGVNWTPIRPNYADVKDDDYRRRLAIYRDIGINLIRVWGGASIEREILYDLCDEYGIMVWQEFPMSSSGVENLPPSDESSMGAVIADADYYLSRLTPHVSLAMWCGGNELQRGLNGEPCGGGKPCTLAEPLLNILAERVKQRDPSRRFTPTSASGPLEFADAKDYGKGLHWDVHGPWKPNGLLDAEWRNYWDNDDALFRSEVGCPGASSAVMIKKYAGDCKTFPCSPDNPLWRYPLSWWNENATFAKEFGREPNDVDEYVAWSQHRQAIVLRYIAAGCKRRFPACGGVIIWMGHDCFPCTANTSIIDYDGECKPAALALKEVFYSSPC